MNGVKLAAEITSLLKSGGAGMVGFADLSGLPADIRGGFPRGVSIGVALNPEIITEIRSGPTARYHQEYIRANRLLDSLGQSLLRLLESEGYRAVFRTATDAAIDRATISGTTDFTTLSTILPHKTVATRAGLGWIGRCALLVTESYGSAVRLTSVLTDALLPAGSPVNQSSCGNCRECVDACPANAIKGEDWKPGNPRDSMVDAFTCRDAARELSFKNFGEKVTICGICIAACPWTLKYTGRRGQV